MASQLGNSNFYTNSPGLHNTQKKEREGISQILQGNNTNENQQQPFNNQTSIYNTIQPSLIQTQQITSPHQQTFPQGTFPIQQSYINNNLGAGQPGVGANAVVEDPAKVLEDSIFGIINIFKDLKGLQEEQEPDKEKNEGVVAKDLFMFFQSSRPQLGKEYQEILDDFLENIEFNMMNRQKITKEEFKNVLENIQIKDQDKALTPHEMATLFSLIDKRRKGTINYEDICEFFKEDFNKGKESKEELMKNLAFISRNGEINCEEFFNIMNHSRNWNYS